MVIRLDGNRLKDVVDRTAEPIGVDGDPSSADVTNGVSEADKIIEIAKESMVNAGISDNPETREEVHKKMLQKMAEEEPGPELAVDEQNKPGIEPQPQGDSSENENESDKSRSHLEDVSEEKD